MKDNMQQTKQTRSISFRADEACQRAISAYIEQTGLKQSDAIRRLIEQGDSKVIIKDLRDIVQILSSIETLLSTGKSDVDTKKQVSAACGKLLSELRRLIEGRDN